jgi:type IV pilus assembly protein PilY1
VWAQADTNPPLPNAMLLIDSSGSMEYTMGLDKTGKPALPKCANGDPNGINEQNRWATLATVLTGEIPQFACVAQSRSDPAFASEFSINGKAPYDKDYYLPYNRMVSYNSAGSEACVLGPDTTKWPSGGVFSFPPDAIRSHKFNSQTACAPIGGATGALLQSNDGLLDAFGNKVRFGLMTFDSSPAPGTGLVGANGVDAAVGFDGMWSYYNGWDTGGAGFATGKPEQCTLAQTIEVGARNPAAPPWEGRMIAFGDYAASASDVQKRNDQIQQAVLAIRPYGATPTAGLMEDAAYFFTTDGAVDYTDPANAAKRFGPKDDPFVAGGCRQQFIILLTDGIPNLDLRDGCKNNPPGAPNGTCPFRTPADTAYALSHPGDPNRRVRTFVVGFAFSQVDVGGPIPLDCSTIIDGGGNLSPQCANPVNDGVRACCETARIAYNGGTTKPRFADDKPALRKALNDILSEVAQNTTSRTTPVFANASGGTGGYVGGQGIAAYNFFSSFKVSSGQLWQGVLERQRLQCTKDNATQIYKVDSLPIDKTKGDSFSTNVNSGQGPPRRFYTIEPSAQSGVVHGAWSVRMGSAPADGVGLSLGTVKSADAAAFYNVPSTAVLDVAVSGVTQSVCGTVKTPVAPDDCRSRIMRWELGLAPTDGSLYTREGAALGSIYHSTPATVGAPGEFLRDESYTNFVSLQKSRPTMLYTATTDGQLHAFQVAAAGAADPVQVSSQSNNELWSFIPPAALPGLKALYPGVENRLLDTPVITRDVIFDRTRDQAKAGAAGSSWNSMLVTGLGPASKNSPTPGGYFAMDVTNPVRDANNLSSGPVFKWQVTTDSKGNPLFGSSGTPVITTLFFRSGANADAHEIAVAILPGGASSTINNTGCPRTNPSWQTTDGVWKARGNVNCYADTDASRSITIVRLDNGEVVQRFHACKNGAPAYPYPPELLARSKCVPFDSPITSVPVVYPNGTGQVSTRAFVGDQDGTMWRLDLSSLDPSSWGVNMFFDAYAAYPGGTTLGQPISTPPALSVDPVGNLVVVFATGDQEQFLSSPGVRNVLWSVSEAPDLAAGTVGSKANWHLGTGTNEAIPGMPLGVSTDWNNGVRVSGPVSLFNGAVYFSTYVPPPVGVNACDVGSSVLWGVDYLESTSPGNSNAAPKGRLDLGLGVLPLPPASLQANALIFGVGIQRLPSCYDTSSVSDPAIGYGGAATSVSNLTSGDYRLVVQTGSKGVNVPGGQSNVNTFNLPAPASGAKISSWAAVVE